MPSGAEKLTMNVSRGCSGIGGIKKLRVSIQHGYLWIGDANTDGPCLCYISGPKTLRKIAAMIRRGAR